MRVSEDEIVEAAQAYADNRHLSNPLERMKRALEAAMKARIHKTYQDAFGRPDPPKEPTT